MKYRNIIFAVLLIVLISWGWAWAGSIPNQSCKIYFRDKHIIISEPLSGGGYGQEKGYQVKGTCYQPIPIGENYDYFEKTASDVQKRVIYERDFALLESAGFNTIRTWTEVDQILLDTAYRHKIKVCMGFFIDYKFDLSLEDPVRKGIKERFTKYVKSFKNHPAVLFWMLGNEQNLTNGNNTSWYILANELGKSAHDLEGANRHPVAIVEGGLGNIGNPDLSANDSVLKYIDLWAINVYRGSSFGNLFTDYIAKSGKPLLISEYGIDAYDSRKGQEDEMTQMVWDRGLWQEIAANYAVCVGATIMNYSDNWWKIVPYYPSGYMGDSGNIVMDDKYQQDNFSLGRKCLKFTYSVGIKKWAGLYWLFPPDNWGNLGPGLDLSDFGRICFWARGEKGSEKIEFKIGGLTDKAGNRLESANKSLGVIILKKGWNEYVLNLNDQNLKDVKGGFCWVAIGDNNPGGCIFYLDKIRYESADGRKVFYLYDDSSYTDMIKEHQRIQDNNGFHFTNTFPDGQANEEWWGMVAIKKNNNGVDIIQPRLVFYNLFKPISQGKPVSLMPPVVESPSLCIAKGFTKYKLNDGIIGRYIDPADDKQKMSLAFPGGKWYDPSFKTYILFDYAIDLQGYYDLRKVKFYWLYFGNVPTYTFIDFWLFFYSDPLTHTWKLYSPASGKTKYGENITEREVNIFTNKVRVRGYGRNLCGIFEMEVFGKKRPGFILLENNVN